MQRIVGKINFLVELPPLKNLWKAVSGKVSCSSILSFCQDQNKFYTFFTNGGKEGEGQCNIRWDHFVRGL